MATYVVDGNQAELAFGGKSSHKSSSALTDKNVANNLAKLPVAIYMDGGSASAAEVLAGSLHDNCRAVLVGSHSFGKGLIQAVYGLNHGGAGLVLTVAQYLTPNGNDIQGRGLDPDIPLPTNILTKALNPGMGGSSSDVRKIDFANVRQRLAMCQPPIERPSSSKSGGGE